MVMAVMPSVIKQKQEPAGIPNASPRQTEPKLPFSTPQGGIHAFGSPTGQTAARLGPGGSPAAQNGASIPRAQPTGITQPRVPTAAPPGETGTTPQVARAARTQGQPKTYGNTGGTAAPAAPSGPPKTYGQTGGTPAPPSAAPAGSPDQGMPNTAPTQTVNLQPTPTSLNDEILAQQGWAQSQAEYNQAVQTALQAYSGGPDSALALAELKSGQRNETSVANRGLAKTMESSLRNLDVHKIGEEKNREDLLAYQRYQSALGRAANALAKARINYEAGLREAHGAEVEGAEKNMPEAAGAEKAKANKTSTAKTGKAKKGSTKVPKIGGSYKGSHVRGGGSVRKGPGLIKVQKVVKTRSTKISTRSKL